MNRVLLTGRLTRDPEMRSLASGKVVTQFSLATNEYRGGEDAVRRPDGAADGRDGRPHDGEVGP